MITIITSNNFASEILQSDKPVLVDFWASWCGPCRMLAPVVEEIAAEHPEVKVCKVNVDDEPALAGQFGIMSIPTLLVFRDGKVVNSSVGVRPREDTRGSVRRHPPLLPAHLRGSRDEPEEGGFHPCIAP